MAVTCFTHPFSLELQKKPFDCWLISYMYYTYVVTSYKFYPISLKKHLTLYFHISTVFFFHFCLWILSLKKYLKHLGRVESSSVNSSNRWNKYINKKWHSLLKECFCRSYRFYYNTKEIVFVIRSFIKRELHHVHGLKNTTTATKCLEFVTNMSFKSK